MKLYLGTIILIQQKINISADKLVAFALAEPHSAGFCILDSCSVGALRSNQMIIGLDPVETLSISNIEPSVILDKLESLFNGNVPMIFTLSYDFGMKLQQIKSSQTTSSAEPDIFATTFNSLVVHDYDTRETTLIGNAETCQNLSQRLIRSISNFKYEIRNSESFVKSNFTKSEYLAAVENIRERIRRGYTYQTNLTQQLTAELSSELTPQQIFWRLKRQHPAPFSAYIERGDSTIISASPELFFRVENGSKIVASPIKGTRPRGRNTLEDNQLRHELVNSKKDLAENTMIVDLLRNDIGRVCEFGSVVVEKLCEIEEHPSLFHLVSTISGKLRDDAKTSDIIKALFPCGSITGAPKISTMQIIDDIEPTPRGLSMGALGCYLPSCFLSDESRLELSVAIRTMVIRERTATFNVGGGIVIDSDGESEYVETLTKATSLLDAIGGNKSDLNGV